MSSSDPCKSHLEYVHDSDSEFRIEYVPTHSPLSPKISLTSHIVSSMNVSGFNIDVGNATAKTSTNRKIENISVTPIPLIPLIHKLMCMRNQEKNQKVHQTLIHNPIFHMTSSLILIRILGSPRNPLGKVDSNPSLFHLDLRFIWAIKNRLMVGKKRTWEDVTPSELSEGNPGSMLHQSKSF
ncbi:hypothetical protein O181_002014 [Austropuccinia psidii MF-1]|uniref:Uncharacterized protein n=1 Tax=Austropuccinia psidii MF-1 TaxID=1389203 RepID=A0A9Q3BBJ7_9BASI|nr:hypothetical protein [Austropuccinia psidii MF-1]